jgi:membrane protein
MISRLQEFFRLLKDSGERLFADQGPMMGAALAYYMIFSIAPLLVIAIGFAGLVFGKSAGTEAFDAISGLVGPSGAAAIHSMVSAAAAKPREGLVATVAGVAALLIGAGGVFSQLQQSLNIIWRVAALPGAAWKVLLRQRLLSFGMVAVIGLLLLVSLIVSAALAAAGTWAAGVVPGTMLLWSAANGLVSFAIISGLFAAVFKLLPDVRLSWTDVRAGGALTALLFVIGKAVIGAYLGRSGVASGYGAAGSLIVVLLWVFYSAQILLFGAEFTRAWITRHGREAEPKLGAAAVVIPLTATAGRAEAGANPIGGGSRERLLELGGALFAAGAVLLLRGRGKGRPAFGALVCGAGAGLWVAAELAELLSGVEKPRPSAASRLIARIPARVKLAAAGGALRSGGRELLSEVASRVRERL